MEMWLGLTLGAVAVGLAVLLARSRRDLSAAKKKLGEMRTRYEPIIDVEEERDRIAAERDGLRAEVRERRTTWKAEFEQTIAELQELNNQLVSTRDQAAMESFGIYEPEFAFEDPEDFKAKLKEVKDQQKQMVRAKAAAVCHTEWTVEGSKAKGRTMTNRQLRLMLRAFNGESDAALGKVRYNNVVTLEKRIERAFDAINKLGQTNNCEIARRYLQLKLQELHVVHELREKQQEIREEQRAIREQMREEERARREIEKAQADAEKEEQRYNEALAKARSEVEEATGAKHEKLQVQIAELEKRLAEAQETKERAVSRAQLTKSGHVYVVSNLGSFGEGIYKIGMTRRLDPNDRVKELGDASVPFPFDVHAMIYSKNAPQLENALHREFNKRRVNLVNTRKEYFHVDLDEVVTVVDDNKGEEVAEVTFTKAAEAEEYRRTLALIAAQEKREEPSVADQARRSLEGRMKAWQADQSDQ